MDKLFAVSTMPYGSAKNDGYIDQLLKDDRDDKVVYASIYCYASSADKFKKIRSTVHNPTRYFVNVGETSTRAITCDADNIKVKTERIPDTDIANVNWYYDDEASKVFEATKRRRSRVQDNDDTLIKQFVVYVKYSDVRDEVIKASVKSNRTEKDMLRSGYILSSAIRSAPAAREKIFKILKKTVDIPVLDEWTDFLMDSCNSISIYPCRAYYADLENPRNIYAFILRFYNRSVAIDISRALNQGHIFINGSNSVSDEFKSIKTLTDYLEHFSGQLINKAANKFSAVFDPNKESFTADENNYFDFTAYNSSLKMFNTQKNVIGAVSRALNKDNSALIVGEMGVGIQLPL